jgi:hypothetical protein
VTRTYRLIDRRAGAVTLTVGPDAASEEYCGRVRRRTRSEAASLLRAYRRLRASFPTVYAIRREG